VGTGFGERELAMLTARLGPLEQSAPPVADTKGLSMKGVHWARPELVAQVGFSEWTPMASCDIPATSVSATTSGRSRSSASGRRKT
jgi:ATP-dependent DNA ligase